jgi:hypothetical protein
MRLQIEHEKKRKKKNVSKSPRTRYKTAPPPTVCVRSMYESGASSFPFPSLPAPSVVVSSRGNAWLHPVCRSRWRRRFCAPTLVGTPLGRVPKADAGERRKFDHLRRWPPWEQGRTQGRRVARNGGRGGNGDEAERCFALSPEDEEAAVVHRRKSQTAGLVYGPPGRSIDFTECTQGTAVHGPCLRTTTITDEGSAGVGPEEIQRVGPTSCFVPGTRARRGERRVGRMGCVGLHNGTFPPLHAFGSF